MRTSFACVPVAALIFAFALFEGCGSNRAIRSDGGDAASGDTRGGAGGATGDGGAAGRSGVGGATGSGGAAGGVGGATGSGGAAGRSGSGGAGIDGGPQACGARTCPAGQYCCNASCGLCAPIGALCIQIACTDGGITGDASGCAAVPAEDTQCGGTQPPHFYRCVLAELPAPCKVRNIGNVTNTFCCP